MEARDRAVESKKARALDTRRKILIGAAIEQMAKVSEPARRMVRDALDKFVVRPDDRDLFGLEPRGDHADR